MDEQTDVSKNIIDKRSVATHGTTGFLGMVLGFFLGVGTGGPSDADRDLVQVTSTALDRAQAFWSAKSVYWRDAHVVLIDKPASTPCGTADKNSGPFYCPTNERIYLDLSFLRAIKGELARAYVIAHELGHHWQKIKNEANPGIKTELGADCYAGVWMHDEQNSGHLVPGDLDGALAEAAAVGDDRLAPGSSPETWTHGSSAQRTAAVQQGFMQGACP